MTSTNINKIVQSHVNLKPWMLAKNTNEIVNTCIQQIYKQMPHHFRKEKPVKIAAPKPENKGPLRTFKSQEKPTPLGVVMPKGTHGKKSNARHRQEQQQQQQQLERQFAHSLKLSNINNIQVASKLAGINLPANSKRLLKSPNYKIYKSRRFGSSASSSRSSLYRRYDERKKQRQYEPAQINYLVRSFHTSKFEPAYVRYLMPARNQYVEANFGSIPDAIKFSNEIQNDLMKVDSATRGLLATVSDKPKRASKSTNKQKEVPLQPLLRGKYPEPELKDSPVKNVRKAQEKTQKQSYITPEQREYANINVNHSVPLKHVKPSNEMFTAQSNRQQTELGEKHRRNRKQKMGLMMSQRDIAALAEESKEKAPATANVTVTAPTAATPSVKLPSLEVDNTSAKDLQENSSEYPLGYLKKKISPRNSLKLKHDDDKKSLGGKKTSLGSDLMEVTKAPKFQTSSTEAKETKPTPAPVQTPSTSNRSGPSPAHMANDTYLKTAIAAMRAQMTNKKGYQNYRYNRSDFFSTKKY